MQERKGRNVTSDPGDGVWQTVLGRWWYQTHAETEQKDSDHPGS